MRNGLEMDKKREDERKEKSGQPVLIFQWARWIYEMKQTKLKHTPNCKKVHIKIIIKCFNIYYCFLKDDVTLKTGVIAAEKGALKRKTIKK